MEIACTVKMVIGDSKEDVFINTRKGKLKLIGG
jgi:hypothetical protein